MREISLSNYAKLHEIFYHEHFLMDPHDVNVPLLWNVFSLELSNVDVLSIVNVPSNVNVLSNGNDLLNLNDLSKVNAVLNVLRKVLVPSKDVCNVLSNVRLHVRPNFWEYLLFEFYQLKI